MTMKIPSLVKYAAVSLAIIIVLLILWGNFNMRRRESQINCYLSYLNARSKLSPLDFSSLDTKSLSDLSSLSILSIYQKCNQLFSISSLY